MASAANATLTLVSSAGTTLTLGATTDIGIHNDSTAADQGVDGWLVIAEADIAKGSWTGNGQVNMPPSLPGGTDTYYGVMSGYGDVWNSVTATMDAVTPWAVGIIADYEFHCDALGSVLITLYDADVTTVIDTMTITQVPEPMTIALLGLGGLFLRRRK